MALPTYLSAALDNAVASLAFTATHLHRDDFFCKDDLSRTTVCSFIPGASCFYSMPAGTVTHFKEDKHLVNLLGIYLIKTHQCLPLYFIPDFPQDIIFKRSDGRIQKGFVCLNEGLVFTKKDGITDAKVFVRFNMDPDDESDPGVFSDARKYIMLSDMMQINQMKSFNIVIPRASRDFPERDRNMLADALDTEDLCFSKVRFWIHGFTKSFPDFEVNFHKI